jgi:nicotinamide-nucleotide amidase
MLNVKEETLKQFGAVSENTADEMLTGILNLSGSDYAVSVTGLPGQTGQAKKNLSALFL